MSTNLNDLPDNLLAKEPKHENGKLKPGCYLFTHTLDVVRAAETVLTTIEKDFQRFFKLTEDQMERLRATALLAAFCHDLGKANDSFQAMVSKKRKDQAIRHEHLSTLIISLPEVKSWLSGFSQADFEVARLLVLGHHLKAVSDKFEDTKDHRFVKFARPMTQEKSFVVYSDHQQFKKLLERLCHSPFSLPHPTFVVPRQWSFFADGEGKHVGELRTQILREFGQLVQALKKDEGRLNLLMAAKAVLLTADAAASGLRRENKHLAKWIIESLEKGKTADDIERILSKRRDEVEGRERANGNPSFVFVERTFQTQTASLGDRAMLLSPCGSGKTYAAYLWIKEKLKTRPRWKAIFLYPTTGTATEGFKDYASHDEDAALLHSRAEFDLDGMFQNPDDRSQNDYLVEKRLFALGFWPDAIFSATADAFLSFLQNSYSSLCLLPVLARSVVVIDEIHSFDASMFSALLEFLQRFDVPVLMMTASLQKERRERLVKARPDLRVYPQDEDMDLLEDLRLSADFPRYQIHYQSGKWANSEEEICPEEMLRRAREAYSKNLKVLWVVNTVNRCIKIARKLETENAFCYHSRFMYEDRVGRHRTVINAFRPASKGGVIAVTTQVCEMSLDLDADVLITEAAPASSLIQRLGRCKRNADGRDLDVPPGEVHIYQPVAPNPYGELIDSGNVLLSKLNLSSPIKQSELTAVLGEINPVKEREKLCLFTTPMWESYSGDYRLTDEYTVSAVLESRLKKFQELQSTRQSTAGIILQAPARFSGRRSGIWLAVVPDESESNRYRYCAKYGLREVNL